MSRLQQLGPEVLRRLEVGLYDTELVRSSSNAARSAFWVVAAKAAAGTRYSLLFLLYRDDVEAAVIFWLKYICLVKRHATLLPMCQA